MATTDNPATEPVLSDLLYNDATPADAETESPTDKAATEKEKPVDDAESTTEDKTVESTSETSDTDTDSEAEPDEELFDVPDGDSTKKVNRKELVDGYQRQSDYTRKTQAVAAEKARVEESAKVLTDIHTELQTLIMGDVTNVDWDAVRTTDPSEYLRLKEVKAEREKVLENLVAQRNKVIKDKTDAESVALQKALGWSDTKKRQADIDSITGYLTEQGITEHVTSHKLMLAILDAAKYQAFQKTKAETLKEVKKAPKTTAPAKVAKPDAPKTLEDLFYK
jgi:hypothetical protein